MGCECSAEFFDPTPTEEIFLVDSLDDLATTAADKLSRFIKQSLGTNEFEPVGHGRRLSSLNRLISCIPFALSGSRLLAAD